MNLSLVFKERLNGYDVLDEHGGLAGHLVKNPNGEWWFMSGVGLTEQQFDSIVAKLGDLNFQELIKDDS